MKKQVFWPLWMLLGLAILFGLARQAQAQEDFLAPEDAFVFSAQMASPDEIELHFDIANAYYMYRDRLGFSTQPKSDAAAVLGEPLLPKGEVKYDPTFDQNMEVYYKSLTIPLPLSAGSKPVVLDIAYQGCADAGLCYPPMSHQIALEPAEGGWRITGWGADGKPIKPAGSINQNRAEKGVGVSRTASGASGASAQSESDRSSGGLSGLFSANDMGLADAMGDIGTLKTVLVFFALGVLLALTPCVLPMIPILSAIVVRDGAGKPTSRMRGAALAFAYVAGMSVVYTALGVAAGMSGVGLAAFLQTPWVLVLFASMLTVLALATFGAFTFQMPAAIQAKLSAGASRTGRGRFSGVVVMGAISALIVGPCVAAPLAGALLYISQSGDVWLGGAALFAMSWGMGVPLLVVGATSTAWLPKAGAWMNGVTRMFGMLLLATAWYMVGPVVSATVQMMGWGLLLIVGGVMLGFGGHTAGQVLGTLRLFGKGIGVLLLVLGIAQVVGALSGGRDLLSPLGHLRPVAGAAPNVIPQQAAGRSSPNQSSAAIGRLSGTASSGQAPQSGSSMSAAPAGAGSNALGDRLIASKPGLGVDLPPVAREGFPESNALRAGRGQGDDQPNLAASLGLKERYLPDSGLTFKLVDSVQDLDRVLAQADRPVLLDFYADWCVSCHEMERFTFGDPAISSRMRDMILVQADVTANNSAHRELLKRFSLFGPPGIMFFDAKGQYLRDPRVIGFQNSARFSKALDAMEGR